MHRGFQDLLKDATLQQETVVPTMIFSRKSMCRFCLFTFPLKAWLMTPSKITSSFLSIVPVPQGRVFGWWEGLKESSERRLAKMAPGSELERGQPRAVLGYTPDEKLRLQQLRELRRRWLKDQELSPREPVLPPRKPGLVEGFWERFLQPGGLWRKQMFKTYCAGRFVFFRLLIPFWISHYYVKYHLLPRPYGIVDLKPRIYPGDTILESGEVVPPLEIPSSRN